MRRRSTTTALVIALVALATTASAQDAHAGSVRQDARHVRHSIHQGLRETGHAIHQGLRKTGHAIHEGARATGHAIHRGFDKVTGK